MVLLLARFSVGYRLASWFVLSVSYVAGFCSYFRGWLRWPVLFLCRCPVGEFPVGGRFCSLRRAEWSNHALITKMEGVWDHL